MKQDIKISLPIYKIVYSMTFVILLSFVRGVGLDNEIGLVIVQMIPILSIVFFADTYQMEFRDKRWEIITLLPGKSKLKIVIRRYLIQLIYLSSISIIGYWIFYIHKPFINNEGHILLLYGQYIIAVVVVIGFFGICSLILSNIFNNIWKGIGILTIIWMYLISMKGMDFLGKWSVLSYVSRKTEFLYNYDWMAGVIVAIVLIILMILLLPKTFKYRIKR